MESILSKRPSKTAELVTAARAVHTRHDQPVLLHDPFAVQLCGRFWKTISNSSLLTWIIRNVVMRRQVTLIHFIVIRALYGERQLEQAVKRGVKQFVIIGAGYDSFAFRRPELAKQLKIYELDMPATQQEKRNRMKKAGIPEPESVFYVSSDLNSETLVDALIRHGFDPQKPAFFSWFGVTYYLPHSTVQETLSLVVNKTAPGSSIAFDYLCNIKEVPDKYQELHQFLGKFVSRRGEPWRSDMSPTHLELQIQEHGFSHINHLTPERVAPELVKEHSTITCPPIFGLCTATTQN